MATKIKEEIYLFLMENAPKKFNLSQLKDKTKFSYPSVLKWIEVLIAEKDRDPPIQIEDYGSIKLVWIEK